MVNLLYPSRKKYKTNHMYRLKNIKKRLKLDYGDWGIVSCDSGVITPNQIEAARCCLSRDVKHKGRVWVKILPNHIVSKKSKDSRMGAGKGKLFKWLYILKPGEVIFEITKMPVPIMVKTFNLIKKKLNLNIKLIVDKNAI